MKLTIIMLAAALSCFEATALPANNQIQFGAIDALPLVIDEHDSARDYHLAQTQLVNLTIQRGQTIARLFAPYAINGLNARAVFNLTTALAPHLPADKIKIGQQFALKLVDDKVASITLKVGFATELTLSKSGVQWQLAKGAMPTTLTNEAASGQINGSLYVAAKKQQVPIDVINRLILAFSHAVDFQRQIKRGDEFKVVYRQESLANDMAVSKVKQLNYAQLTLSGKTQTLVFFKSDSENDKGGAFYDENGQLAQSFLLKTPVDGARLSSFFGMRKHPILGYNKMHKGLDFGAPVGTPVLAAGDAVIDYIGPMSTFGNLIRLKHANGYQTLYAHLKGFAKGLRKGQLISQSQLIGYVGTTGRSQARHLHYEVHRHGKAINPLSLKKTSHQRLDGQPLANFKLYKQQQLAYLSAIDAG